MKKSITIKDIAKELNISTATVSRALRGSSEISKETKLAVMRIAKEMDYHPNLLARSLINKSSKVLGVVVPTINRQFWSNSISGIESVAYKKGYKVMIFQSAESYQKEVEIVEILANSMVDGILIAFSKETQDFAHIEHIVDRGIPVLLFERVCETLPLSKVKTDDFFGAKSIVNHLIEKGKKRIAYIGGPLSLTVCMDRFLGYQSALEENGIPFDQDLVVEISDFNADYSSDAFKELWKLDIRPDAVFCFADILAIGVLAVSKELGIKIPTELAIAGFGNDDITKYVSPSITTMAQPSFEIGQLAARLILKEINCEDENEFIFKTEIIKPNLIVRESS
ncbi:LacI family DNA-binding transcriptional regulator [Cognataquiflexum rubidum]|uniref:LacI family DNA-binding transcriptional regulator n=1 Tax=Cognataquiflexum rubidum TaxID=2922273 RepID=UPI001F1373F4|nr:LacI family DNA-binding transcriptional regulator [Cognataquiflexum rubidum]MCH6235589.1 LacI family transcriptional regulator [Cognataquiflexum rubidum]